MTQQNHHMSWVRLGTWLGLCCLFLADALLAGNIAEVRATRTALTRQHDEAVELFRAWSTNLVDLDTRLRAAERQEIDFARKLKLLKVETDALQVFRKSLAKKPKLKPVPVDE